MIQPIGARVSIEPYQGDKESESGLILSDANNAQTPVRGKILRVGEESKFKGKEGTVVYFRRYSIDELKGNDKGEEFKLFFCDDADIIACEVEKS